MEAQLIELNKMQSNLKVIVNSHENNMIKLGYEVWRQIDEYPNYSVSSYGRIRNDNKIMKQSIDRYGYKRIGFWKEQKKKHFKVHRLVANSFIPNLENKKCVDHINNDRLNNSINNLRWCSSKENNRNRSVGKRNTSGIKGVTFEKKRKKWRAQITIDGTAIFLGRFDTIEDAKKARINRAKKVFGIFINACEL